MNEWMHVAMEMIKEEAKKSVSTWLEEIRAASLVRTLSADYVCFFCAVLTFGSSAVQSVGEFAIKRFENQVNEQYYEQDILEKCGLPGTSRTASISSQSSVPSRPSTPRASTPATASTSRPPPADDLVKLPSLKVLNLDADILREKHNIHLEYMKKTLDHLTPMLRVLHVFRAMNQVPELAAFYNANRLVSAFIFQLLRM